MLFVVRGALAASRSYRRMSGRAGRTGHDGAGSGDEAGFGWLPGVANGRSGRLAELGAAPSRAFSDSHEAAGESYGRGEPGETARERTGKGCASALAGLGAA